MVTGTRRLLLLVALAVLLVTAAVPAGAATESHRRLEVVASGLDNPRGLSIGPYGVLFVAEAGRGGPGPCVPGPGGVDLCLGQTGAVTAAFDGFQARIATGLPSLGTPDGAEVLGPHDVAITRFGLTVAVGLGTNPEHRASLGPEGAATGQLVRVVPFHSWHPIVDLAAFELANDPDQGQPNTFPDSNPFGLLPDGSGVIVADAGANDILRVDRGRHISVVEVFPVTFVPAPPQLGLPPGTELPMHFVPTTVTRGPDGALYVGQLTGFPFPPGGAKVWRLEPGGEPTVFAGGFTNIIDIAFDHHGRLVVLQISKNGLLSGDPTGALVRVERDGTRTELLSDELSSPTSVAIGPDGSYYISNKGTSMDVGEVLRLSGVG